MIHVISTSTGIVSELTLKRVIDRYGKENVKSVFMDTLFEDDDNYRFLTECDNYLGIKTVVLTEGRSPYQVFTDEHVIPSARFAPCTLRLKLKIFREYIATLPKPLTVHIGYDFSEMHRCDPTRKNYEELSYSVDFPMLWKPIEFRDYATILRNDWGIEPPRMYGMGYTHANCGGRCVKQGQGDWLRTLMNWPERYAAAEKWELDMRQNPVNAEYAILKDRTGGTMRPLTLKELRERYESGQMPKLLDLDAQSGCVVCGVGG